jgi:tripartite-type tricarboxylate transporter receptor subunit TctC
MFDTIPSSIEFIRTGKVRALAVTTSSRYQGLLDIPTVGEFLPGYEASAWQGIGAPTNTPEGIIKMLNKEINAGLADSKLKAKIADLGALPMPLTPAEFGRLIADETEKWSAVVKFAGIKPE